MTDEGALSPQRLRRYSRQVILPGVGVEGQAGLAAASVLVLGAGGLGSPVLAYLAAAGVGTIGIVDDDRVEESNLHRQVIHGVADIGRLKVDSAADAIARLDPAVVVERHPVRLGAGNALELFAAYDVIVDGTDNFATRYLASDACEILRKPCVWGSILRFDGQVTVFWAGRGPTYRDLFPTPLDPALVPSCAEAGVFGVLCASIGAAMGTEVVKLVTGVGRSLVGRLLVYDALEASWGEIPVRADPSRMPVTELVEVVEEVCEAALPGEVGPVELAQLLAGGAVTVVDVREPWERAIVSIPGSVSVPLAELLAGASLPAGPLVVYCKSGARSAQALAYLTERGVDADHGPGGVRNLTGGVLAWVREVDPTGATY